MPLEESSKQPETSKPAIPPRPKPSPSTRHFNKAEEAYGDYQDSLKNWEQRYGEKPKSLHARLKSKKQDIKERELARPYSPPNRGRSR